MSISPGEIIELILKQQAPISDIEQAQELGKRAVDTTSIFLIFVLVLKFTVLSQVLSQVRSLSIICHLLLINIVIPGTVTVFYSEIFAIV